MNIQPGHNKILCNLKAAQLFAILVKKTQLESVFAKLHASAVASQLCVNIQYVIYIGIYIQICHHKYLFF